MIYRDELGQYDDGVQVSYTLTRSQPAGWTGHTGRIGPALLAEVAWPAVGNPLAYICGPTSVLMVLVRRTRAIDVDLSGLANLSQPGSA